MVLIQGSWRRGGIGPEGGGRGDPISPGGPNPPSGPKPGKP